MTMISSLGVTWIALLIGTSAATGATTNCPVLSPLQAKELSLDLAVLVDTSANLPLEDFEAFRSFVAEELLPALTLSGHRVRVALASFDRFVSVHKDFGPTAVEDVAELMGSLRRRKGESSADLPSALQSLVDLRSEEFGSRPSVPTSAIVLTSAKPFGEAAKWTSKLRSDGVQMAFVGPVENGVEGAAEPLGPPNLLRLASLPLPGAASLAKLAAEAGGLVAHLVSGDGRGNAHAWLADLTDRFGHRVVTGTALNRSIDYLLKQFTQQGFSNAHAEAVRGISDWARGREEAELLRPRRLRLPVLGIGDTPPTPGKRPLRAEAVVVRSFEELRRIGSEGSVRGKVVVFNQPWSNYSAGVAYRRQGATEAAQWSAVAVLVRSVTPASVASLHTGNGRDAGIPMASLTVEDAELLGRLQGRGEPLEISLLITSEKTANDVVARDTVFQITGSERPEEVVLLSGHWDSWDVGTGAMDDGGGCAAAWGALKAMKDLGMTPKRTIRVVMWGSEERGPGGKYYHDVHAKRRNETFVFVSESDMGVFRGLSRRNSTLGFFGEDSRTPSGLSVTELIALAGDVAEEHGVLFGVSKDSGPGGDVASWQRDGVAGVNYVNTDAYERYFTYHHTAGDTLGVLTEEDVDHTAAMWASVAWILANV